ncbi:MAG: hypothetical protein NTY74_15285 [Ignavibacteriae bacterium]|nr:hypothetical protein [Ignavibacteriota bacterium]
MAKVRDQHLGAIQGQVGPQVFKILNGDSYVAQLPHRSNVEPSDAVKERRKQFGLTMKFAKAIYMLLMLRLFWKSFIPDGAKKAMTTMSKIAKASYPCVSATEITDIALLAPDFGFAVTTTTKTLANDEFTVVTAALGDTGIIDTTKETTVYLLCVAHLSEPTSNTYSANRFFSLKSAGQILSTSTALTFTIPLDSAMGQVYDAYATKKAFFVLVTTDSNGAPVHFSSTFHTS